MSTAPPDTPPPQDPTSDRVPAAEGYEGVPRSAVRRFDVLAAVLIAVVLIVVGQAIVSAFDPDLIGDPDEASTAGKLTSQLVVVLAMLAAAVGYTASSNQEGLRGALRRLGLRSFRPGPVLKVALAALGLYLLGALVLNLLLSPEQEDIAENLGATGESGAVVTILAGVLIVAGAALGEELMFRGFVFGGLRQSLSLWPAAIGSGLVFGVLHLAAGDAGVAAQLTLFGVIMAWAYERSGVLWTPILLHGANNAIAFTLLITDTV